MTERLLSILTIYLSELYSVLCSELNGKEIQRKEEIHVQLIHFAIQ